MIEPTTKRRVLVIGISPEVNKRAVDGLIALGVDAVGCVGLAAIADFDARDFDLIAVGSGVDNDLRAELRERFQRQAPGIPVLRAYGPFAARQIVWALRGRPPWATDFSVELDDAITVHANVHAACEVSVEVHRYPDDKLEVVPITRRHVEPGPLALSFPTPDGFMLIVSFNDEQHELYRLDGR